MPRRTWSQLSFGEKIGVLTLIVAITGIVLGGVFSLLSGLLTPEARTLLHLDQPTLTPAHAVVESASPTRTTSPSPIPQSNTPTPPSKHSSLTCVSGSLCLSYPMTIWIASIVTHLDGTSTWNFQIVNGATTIDSYLNLFIGNSASDGITGGNGSVQYGPLKLSSNENPLVPITVRYTPSDKALVKITLSFLLRGSAGSVDLSQACTYSAAQKTCQP
jgi:hypothetical protein